MTFRSSLSIIALILLTSSCVEWTSCQDFRQSDLESIIGMDIPTPKSYQCMENGDIQVTHFKIDTEAPAFLQKFRTLYTYINKYKFARIESVELPGLNSEELPKSLQIEIENQLEVFWKEGSNENYKWQVILMREREELVIKVKEEEELFY